MNVHLIAPLTFVDVALYRQLMDKLAEVLDPFTGNLRCADEDPVVNANRDNAMNGIPEGFEPIFRSSPYLDLMGPIFSKNTEEGLKIGLLAEQKHCNARNSVHGGVLSSLADIALGYNAAYQGDKPTPMVTANLTIDFAGSAKLGDWIEISTDIQKIGKSMAFANCYFTVSTKRIVRASGVFAIINK
ncbi:MAG: PaaI family thioesterase [Pseudomonadota bacterium]